LRSTTAAFAVNGAVSAGDGNGPHTAGAEAEGEEAEEEEEQSLEEKVVEMFCVEFDNESDPRSTKVILTAMDQVGGHHHRPPSSLVLPTLKAVGWPRESKRLLSRCDALERVYDGRSGWLDSPAHARSVCGVCAQPNLLCSVAQCFNSMGCVVRDASVTTNADENMVNDVFVIQDQHGNQISEDDWPKLKEYLEGACTQSQSVTSSSTPPAIYGMAAAAEARFLRSSLEEGGGGGRTTSMPTGGQGVVLTVPSGGAADANNLAEEAEARGEAAAALELAAAEMAQAAAALVTVERAAAEFAMQAMQQPDDASLASRLMMQEEMRVEASAVLERRMAAMEAALASRRQLKEALSRQQSSAPAKIEPTATRDTRPALQNIGTAAPPMAPPPSTVGTGPACGQGYELILQGFNWESCHGVDGHVWYEHMQSRLDEFAEAGFTSIWLPPPTASVSLQGYLPTDLYDLTSQFGNEEQLMLLLKKMKERNLKSVADIVINHRCASTQKDGKWNQYGGRLAWNESAITSNNPEWGGTGNRGTGEEYEAAPNIDHTQEYVRSQLKDWMKWMREHVGFDGWRFDYVKGYSGEFTKEYVDATVPKLAFGEYWDACSYSDGVLSYNQDEHRQRTVDWCDRTGGTTAAFDFTTKGILQEAIGRNELWRLVDGQGRPPGMMGLWPSRAVTFIDNHDTGSTLNHWPFPWDQVPAGYAYLLTHPGTPTIFLDHWNDSEFNPCINELMQVRSLASLASLAPGLAAFTQHRRKREGSAVGDGGQPTD